MAVWLISACAPRSPQRLATSDSAGDRDFVRLHLRDARSHRQSPATSDLLAPRRQQLLLEVCELSDGRRKARAHPEADRGWSRSGWRIRSTGQSSTGWANHVYGTAATSTRWSGLYLKRCHWPDWVWLFLVQAVSSHIR